MNAIGFFLGALGLFGLSTILIWNTDPHRTAGGAHFERRRQRRLIGKVLIVVGLLLLALAVLSQSFSSNASFIVPHPIITDASPPRTATPILSPRAPAQIPSTTSAAYFHPALASPVRPQADTVSPLVREAYQLLQQKQVDAALDKVNAAIEATPQNAIAYGLRGGIYADKKLWDQAEKDYRTAIQMDGKDVRLKFDLVELQFLQKKYDGARLGFVALEHDPNIGDLAAFKVFLCDLFGAHEETAASELDAFNQAGSNASYYFANATWSLYHHKTEDARGWLQSAATIYPSEKFSRYAASLLSLGYMPLPPPP